jgi:hypothetical protein
VEIYLYQSNQSIFIPLSIHMLIKYTYYIQCAWKWIVLSRGWGEVGGPKSCSQIMYGNHSYNIGRYVSRTLVIEISTQTFSILQFTGKIHFFSNVIQRISINYSEI